jgi:CSLREA domain-containing protein
MARRALLSALAIALAAALLVGATPALAATITVTTSADENGENAAACSLREAIATANFGFDIGGCAHSGSFGADEIVFAPNTDGDSSRRPAACSPSTGRTPCGCSTGTLAPPPVSRH